MSRAPKVRSTEVACRQCGTALTVHLPPLVYTRLKLMGAGETMDVWAVSCPGPECEGMVVVTAGDLHRAT